MQGGGPPPQDLRALRPISAAPLVAGLARLRIMKPCTCTQTHQRRRIVPTGGPGAGKTAVLELLRPGGRPPPRQPPARDGAALARGWHRGSGKETNHEDREHEGEPAGSAR